jgi:hypothetical protein
VIITHTNCYATASVRPVRACAAVSFSSIVAATTNEGAEFGGVAFDVFLQLATGHIGSIKNKKPPYQVHHITEWDQVLSSYGYL